MGNEFKHFSAHSAEHFGDTRVTRELSKAIIPEKMAGIGDSLRILDAHVGGGILILVGCAHSPAPAVGFRAASPVCC
jgi:hypothetical protein